MVLDKSGVFPYGRSTGAMTQVSTVSELESAIADSDQCIEVASGTYNLTKDLTLTNVMIKGCGAVTINTTTFTWTLSDNVLIEDINSFSNTTADIFTITGTDVFINRCGFTTNDSGSYAIELLNGDDTVHISYCEFDGGSTGRLIGDKQSTTGGQVDISNCLFLNSGLVGISITGEKPSLITNCEFSGGATGVEYHTPSGTDSNASGLIEGCIFDNQSSEAIIFETATRVYNYKQIKNCNFSNQVDCINITGNSASTGSISILGNTVNDEPSGDFITNTLDTTIMKDNQFFQSVSGSSETAKRGTSLVHCDTSSNDITLTLLTLARGSAGSRTVVRKTDVSNNVSISGSANDFTDFSWSANNVSFQFEWTGDKWKRENLYASEYAIYDMSADLTISNSSLTTIDNWDLQEGNSSWSMSSGVLTPGVAGTYGISCVISWASDSTGYRQTELQKNDVITRRVISRVAPTSGTTDFFESTGMFSLSASDDLRVKVIQTSGGNLDVINGNNTTFLRVWRIS